MLRNARLFHSRFDDIPEFRSYVQSKGRARAKPSKFIMMADANKKADIKAKINSYRCKEKRRNIL